MKNVLIFMLLLFPFLSCRVYKNNASTEFSSIVFVSGVDNYSHYRIPAILCIDRVFYAFAEARKSSVDDNGNISIVMKTSKDFGKTWSQMTKVLELEGESVQNPVPVFVKEEDKLLVLFTKRTNGNDTEHDIRSGTSKGYMGVYAIESHDFGKNWSAVKEITRQVKKDNWRWYTLGPGGAIVLEYNKQHKGRIVVPANHSTNGGAGNEFLGAHAIFSDDNGKTWQIGALDSEGEGSVNPNETAVIELNNGDLYFNTRNQA